MLVIRFLRVGKRNQPAFKIVVTDKKTAPKSGKFIEQIGFYNPLTREKVLKKDRIKYWLSVGAKPSPRVHNLLIKEKILEGKKIPVHKKPKKKKTEKETAQKEQEKKQEKSQDKKKEQGKSEGSQPQ